jgi:2Fe-2S ferredoxin
VDVEVRFQPAGKKLRVPSGTRILDAARQAGLPVARACGANGLCARCGVVVLDGRESVSAETPDEVLAKRANRIDASMRLSCMVTVSGNVQITASYW